MCESYFETEEYKKHKLKLNEIFIQKFRMNLPHSSNFLANYIDRWAELHTYIIKNYENCKTDEMKRLFFKEFFEKKEKLTTPTIYGEEIRRIKNLLSFCQSTYCKEINFFHEFIERKLQKHHELDPHYTLEYYFISDKQEIYDYYIEKINEIEDPSDEMKKFKRSNITRQFINEKKCLEDPMNIEIFLQIRNMRNAKKQGE